MVVVSPRNYFLYTPLLPAVAVGTMEERRWVGARRAEACLMLRLLALVKRAAGCSTSRVSITQ